MERQAGSSGSFVFDRTACFCPILIDSMAHGPGYGLSQIGIIDFVDRRAHPEMRATYLNIATVARMSLASALGGILGSTLIERWGGHS